MLRSTTNLITLIVIVLTGLFLAYAMIAGIKGVPAELYGFWGMIIGWIVGAKSSKTKKKIESEDYYPDDN